MREIYLDFLHQSKPTSRYARWLLAAGIALGLAAIIANSQGEAALSAARDAARATENQLTKTVSGSRSAARALIANDPAWDLLLTRLEQTKPKGVAIMQLEADGAAGTASIVAETADAQEMLAYLGKLGGEPGLQQVILSQHVETESLANGAIRFTLRMQWGRP